MYTQQCILSKGIAMYALPITDHVVFSDEKSLCEQLQLDKLWDTLGFCLSELSHNNDQNAVLILQPAVETFFLVHAGL